MTADMKAPKPSRKALSKSIAHFARPKGAESVGPHGSIHGLGGHPAEGKSVGLLSRAGNATLPRPVTTIRNEMGQSATGINLASQDYLGLSSHPEIKEAATEALNELGPHSAGSPCLLGNTPLSLRARKALGSWQRWSMSCFFLRAGRPATVPSAPSSERMTM